MGVSVDLVVDSNMQLIAADTLVIMTHAVQPLHAATAPAVLSGSHAFQVQTDDL